MKKIGLLTFASNTNYGSWCQSYALYKVIQDKGYDIEIIDYHYKEADELENIDLAYIVNILKNRSYCYSEKAHIIVQRAKVVRAFRKESGQYWKKSLIRYSPSNIVEANDVYDVFLIGSDLVWDHRYAGSTDDFFLGFVSTGKRKIAYAASSGYTQMSLGREEKEKIQKYLSEFDYITVRENNLKDLFMDTICQDVPVVCDPTLLLSADIWKAFVHENKELHPYVLVYMVDDLRMIDIAIHYARKHGLDVICIGYGHSYYDSHNRHVKTVQPLGVSDWISLIYYAEKVFTGSYHGTLFSIYFKSEFSFCYRKPITRFYNISQKLKLEKYEIHHPDYDVEKQVEWEEIKNAEDSFREYSMRILEEMLNVAFEGNNT